MPIDSYCVSSFVPYAKTAHNANPVNLVVPKPCQSTCTGECQKMNEQNKVRKQIDTKTRHADKAWHPTMTIEHTALGMSTTSARPSGNMSQRTTCTNKAGVVGAKGPRLAWTKHGAPRICSPFLDCQTEKTLWYSM